MTKNSINIKGTIQEPNRHPLIPATAQWLSGEGAGSWFYFEQNTNTYTITRFSPHGNTECSGVFTTDDNFNFNQLFDITFLSHCAEVNVVQSGKNIKFSLK